MNTYAQLAALKTDRRIQSINEDAALLRLLGTVSRAIDDVAHRRFYSEVATRYFDGNGRASLWLMDDIVSITSLLVDDNADGTYEKTLVADTDYWLYPDNSSPKIRIDLNPNSSVLSRFPSARRAVKVTGLFGYSNDTELTGATLNDDGGGVDASETAITLAAGGGALLSVGETVLFAGDPEQVSISAIVVDTITVVRAINGTTGAVHANGLAVYRRRYPEPIERAASLQVTRLLRETQTAQVTEGSQVNPAVYQGGFVSSLYPMIRDLVMPYARQVVG